MPPVILQVFPRYRKVMTLQDKLLDMYYRLRSVAVVASHFKIIQHKNHYKKRRRKISEAVSAPMPPGMKVLC